VNIVPAHNVFAMKQSEYMGFPGRNPNIRVMSSLDEADYIWYCCCGDGGDVVNDLAALNRIDKPLISVTLGDEDYSKCLSPANLTRHFTPATTDWQRCVPYHCATRGDIPYNAFRPILASFRGSFSTYGPRKMLLNIRAEDIIIECQEWWGLTEVEKWPHALRFEHLMLNSRFMLCPKGAGKSSMRVVQTMFYGSLPVLIDDVSRPYNNSMDFVVRASFKDLAGLVKVLRRMTPEEYAQRIQGMQRFVEDYLKRDERAGCVGTLGHSEYIRSMIEK